MAINGSVSSLIELSHTKTQDLATGSFPLSIRQEDAVTDGTGDGQVDSLYTDEHQLAASGTQTYNLYTGLTDAWGDAFQLLTLKTLQIRVTDGDGTLQVNASGSNLLTSLFGSSVLGLKEGDVLQLHSPDGGWGVTASNYNLVLEESGGANTVTFEIVLAGVAR